MKWESEEGARETGREKEREREEKDLLLDVKEDGRGGAVREGRNLCLQRQWQR